MRKLIKMYKSLPREMRMMLAMAGLGTPFGLFYLLNRVFFPGVPIRYVIFGMIGAFLVIGLIVLILTKLFKRGGKKRSQKMAAELAADADSGRVSMDVAAAIKANNDKFFTAIKDMRKNIGISVYDLPWYIVIGDSGCGKTKLINEGGLQFSTGKPEGYQLGTLNYNWWFTEDAVFVDMAGRLCNPRDDADRREWEAFLNTVAKGRRGFPINGTVVCVSADHLLQDPPEKIEQDANTTLERLRDIQTKLGVTFATYLVVTKCDKIVGFMQFFDRAERDITVLNQMFGWSKKGDFSNLYDPESFPEDFDDVYRRLYELRLRRLNDEAEEIDLGLAYSFPEEFRELLEPLQTYMRTLFPKIKNPRAIKNLLFRGLYFTSATREGGLILKHLTERLGPEAASQFAPLDLYPSKRPYFIKDLLFRKMFPEHGLVFRNEQQAVRNRKVARLMKWGSVTLAVLMAGVFWLSSTRFESLIGTTRTTVTKLDPASPPPPADALEKAAVLNNGIANLSSHSAWAWILSWGLGADRPVNGLRAIQASLFERVLLREALADISDGLERTQLEPASADDAARREGEDYLAAFEEYLRWYGCADATTAREQLDAESFGKMCKVVTARIAKDSPIITQKDDFFAQASNYFSVVKALDDWPSPARALMEGDIDAPGTILAAMRHVETYLSGYATLTDNHPDEDVREWMRIQTACATIEDTYKGMLSYANDLPRTLEELIALKETFRNDFQSLADAVDGLEWRVGPKTVAVKVPDLRDAILAQRAGWHARRDEFQAAYRACASNSKAAVLNGLTALCAGSTELRMAGLDRTLWESLRDTRLTEEGFDPEFLEPDAFKAVVRELYVPYGHVFQLVRGSESESDRIVATKDVEIVRDTLGTIRKNLEDADLEPPDNPGTPSDWVAELGTNPPDDEESGFAEGSLDAIWQPDKLALLFRSHRNLIFLGEGRRLLDTISVALSGVGEWGFAELLPDYQEKVRSFYRIAGPQAATPTEPKPEARETPDTRRRRRPPPGRRRGAESGRPERSAPAPRNRATQTGAGFIAKCATRQMLFGAATEGFDLLYYLQDFDPDVWYLPSDADDAPLNRTCMRGVEDATEKYMRSFVHAWSNAYEDATLIELDRLTSRARDWGTLARLLNRQGTGSTESPDAIADECATALEDIFAALPYWEWDYDPGRREWYVPNERGPEWSTIVSIMQGAIDKEWRGGAFAEKAEFPDGEFMRRPEDAPWSALAGEFANRFTTLAEAIAKNGQLKRRFDVKVSDREKEQYEIPWGKIAALRDAARLDDEKLTGQLVEFEKKAQDLLSEELTNILVDIQEEHFSRAEPVEGWPYLSGPDDRSLATVDYGDFKHFLREIQYAQDAFKPLEEGFSRDDPLARKRSEFYHRCEDWRDFLVLTDSLGETPLGVEVDRRDPLRGDATGFVTVDDTPQLYYSYVELDLGLETQKDGRYAKTALKVYTKADKQAENRTPPAVWQWNHSSDQEALLIRFGDGMTPKGRTRPYPDLEEPLGDWSPLAFCAYLQRWGKGEGTEWLTTHSMNLPERLKEKGNGDYARQVEETGKAYYGLSFMFKLDRPMPRPIAKLERAGGGRSRGEDRPDDDKDR